MKRLNLFIFILLTLVLATAVYAQQTGSIRGQVFDSLGAVVVGANVSAVEANGKEKNVVTNEQGSFVMSGLAAGKYTVRVVAPKFAIYEKTEVEIKAGEPEDLNIVLKIQEVSEQVDIPVSGPIGTDLGNNKSATVLNEKDVESLPDDPEELAAMLQALAGPGAGPDGGQIYVDGFTGGRIPPREAIREIRINQNPFSAEFDRTGQGRIEIITKIGSDKFRGQGFFNFNDEILNARNPFAVNRAPSQTRFYGGSLSGPVWKGSNKSSFFIDLSNREIDNGSLVNALILDQSLNIASFQEEFTVPSRRFSVSPRLDYTINGKNALTARYSLLRLRQENQGVGDTRLPSLAYSTLLTENNIRLTETMIINPKTVSETRFQYEVIRNEQNGDKTIPTVTVISAFTGGGAQVGSSYFRQNFWELLNNTTTSVGQNNRHTIKFGIRIRHISVTDHSENNFGGSFTFSGFFAANDQYDLNADGLVSPLEQYRAGILGATDARYLPSQFRITGGDPLADVTQTDVGLYVLDEMRVNPSLTIGFGLRYERQTNISDKRNFAPRLSFAWAPGRSRAGQPKTVIGGGFGYFYDHFSKSLTLQANRFDGSRQLNYLVSAFDPDPTKQQAAIALLSQAIFGLNGITNVPTAAQIGAALPVSGTIQRVSPDLQVPRTIQFALGVEQQLPLKTTFSLFYTGSRTWNALRSRNINAPLCQSITNCTGAARPNPTAGNIYQYESGGVLHQHQLMTNFRTQISKKISLFGDYRFGMAKSDTDGVGSFPADSYDLSNEYGYSSIDARHTFFIGGQMTMPWDLRVSPLINASSGRAFNITSGVDANGDTLYTERPTFAQLKVRCVALKLSNSFCEMSDVPDLSAVIPRNYGRGPGFFAVNLNINRSFGLGSERPNGAGGGARSGANRPYNLTAAVLISNLFNTPNYNLPVGNLSSSRFGQSTATVGGNGRSRRIELQLRFNF